MTGFPTKILLRGFAIFFFCSVAIDRCLCRDKPNPRSDPIRDFLGLDADTPLDFATIETFEPNVRLQKRESSTTAGTRLQLRAFGRRIDLWLSPKRSHLASLKTAVYLSKYSVRQPGNLKIVKKKRMMKHLGQLFEDPAHLASLMIGETELGIRINGHIGSKNFVVRTVPPRIMREYRSNVVNNEYPYVKYSNKTFHVVFRSKDYYASNDSALDKRLSGKKFKKMPGTYPKFLFPKILAVVDHSLWQFQGEDIYAILEYLLAFFNGVDLRYRVLKGPNIRLLLVGILIGLDQKALPYVSNSMLAPDTLSAERALKSSSFFFYNVKNHIPLETYDIAVTLTRHFFERDKGTRVVGKSFTASACTNYTKLRLMISTAITRDNGAFSGISTAAHEIGHALGMNHDVDDEHCSPYADFIMAPSAMHTANSRMFSPCSLENLQQQIDLGALECMYRRPKGYGKNFPRLMPGRLLEPNEHCNKYNYEYSCEVSPEDVCLTLQCRNTNGTCRKLAVAALDGSPCHHENEIMSKYCVHGKCVDEELLAAREYQAPAFFIA